MNTDDVSYLIFLFFSMVYGMFYGDIKNPVIKKRLGSIIGLSIVLLVSGPHTIHLLITFIVNAFIILYMTKRNCHIVSFGFSFLYLIFFRTTGYFGIPYAPSHTNLIQMILTLKLVGLAFEANTLYISKKKSDQRMLSAEEKAELEASDFTLCFSDIFHYSFNYIGVLTGPYFRFRTFNDHLSKVFHKNTNSLTNIFKKLYPLLPIYVILYLLTDYLWPLSYTQSAEFEERSFFYRYWYIWPTFLNFRMRIYIGLTLSECVCIMGGLGAYPSFTRNQPGHGPTCNFLKMKQFCENHSSFKGKEVEFDYETVHSLNPYGTEFYPTLREGMKNWNMTVQYWLASCIYKRFPSKKFRTFATMFVSAVWHGVYSGYYISIGMIPFGLIVEDIWGKILLKDNRYLPRKVGYGIMLFLKMQFFSYSALAFSLLDVQKIMHYYNLVYHWMIYFCVIMFFVGSYLVKLQKKSECKNLSKLATNEQNMEETNINKTQ